MFSKILIKLIDQAIVPAILLLVSRIVSMIGFSLLLNIPYAITNVGFTFDSAPDYVLVNSYSVMSMIVVLSLGIFYVLIKSYVFHESHVEPRMTAQLFSLRLSGFIQTSFDLYSQGAVWLSYIYLLFLVSIFMAFFGLVYIWVFVVSLLVAIISTVALVFDIEQEMVQHPEEIDEIMEVEEYVWKFE